MSLMVFVRRSFLVSDVESIYSSISINGLLSECEIL